MTVTLRTRSSRAAPRTRGGSVRIPTHGAIEAGRGRFVDAFQVGRRVISWSLGLYRVLRGWIGRCRSTGRRLANLPSSRRASSLDLIVWFALLANQSLASKYSKATLGTQRNMGTEVKTDGMASSQAQSESEVSSLGVYKGQQIIEASRIDGAQTIIDKCPICGKTHRHGIPTSKTINKLIHKAAHCGSSDVDGYWLVYTHDTKGWKP